MNTPRWYMLNKMGIAKMYAAQPAGAQQPGDERAAFEQWSKVTNQGYDLARNVSGKLQTFESTETEHAWRGFFHGLRASHGQAPAAQQAGEQPLPLLVRDIAADFATTPIQVCMALSALGFGGHSLNMVITPTMAQALRAHFSATAQAAPQQEAASVDLKTMELAESVGLIGPASRTHDLHAAIQRFHDLICANATIKAAQMAAEAISEAAPQQEAQYNHGPQAETVAEAARDVGKWLNERPNRPIDLRHVAMLCAHAQPAPQQEAPAIPSGWVSCTIAFDGSGPEEVAYGPKIMMDRLAKWLGKHFERTIAEKAAPQPLPASQGDALDAACQRACMELPEGMSMAIQLERNAGWIELHGSYGDQIELLNADGSLAEQVHQAIDAARAAQEDKSCPKE